MFGDKLTAAHAKITSLVALIAATGFKIDAAAILDPKTEASALPTADAFKAHLAGQTTAAVDAATAPLAATISGHAPVAAAHASFVEAFTAAGVKLGDFVAADQGQGNTPEAKAKNAAAANTAMIKTAIETRIASASAKQIAAAGHPHALEVPAGPNADQPSASETPQTKEAFHAALNAITDPGDRTAYFRKHKAKFTGSL